jgi:hypothetical protein
VIFQAMTEDCVAFNIQSERWFEARSVARRFGAEELTLLEGEHPRDLLIEWRGSDANRSGDKHMVIHGEDRLRKKIERVRRQMTKPKKGR